tara:strand:- start:29870 stop:30010 length:141 start_codon:yes stop_codon:yes gene_type:complete
VQKVNARWKKRGKRPARLASAKTKAVNPLARKAQIALSANVLTRRR